MTVAALPSIDVSVDLILILKYWKQIVLFTQWSSYKCHQFLHNLCYNSVILFS